MFTIRWLLPSELQRERYPAIAHIGPSFPVGPAIFYTIVFYLIWQLLYYAFIVYGRREKVSRGLRTTSYTWLLADKDGFFFRLVRRFGLSESDENHLNRYTIAFYFVLQFTYTLLSILPAGLFFYQYM